MKTVLGMLKEITDLRQVWPHEAKDFTPWLAEEENMNLLGDALGLDITADETESDVGDFSVDILATENGTGRKVIIENQLEDTNHDHLGKLITYASGKAANIIVWLVKHAREEHRSAIEWLNNHTDEQADFFLCEIKLYQIGNSAPAVKFEVIERPNAWSKSIRTNDSMRPSQQFRLEYWTAFNDYAFKKKEFAKAFGQRKPSKDHWMDLSIGSSACHLAIDLIRKNAHLIVELYINEDKSLFKTIYADKEEIESAIGASIEWAELPQKKASRIMIIKDVDFDDKSQWPEQFEWIVDISLKAKKAFQKYL